MLAGLVLLAPLAASNGAREKDGGPAAMRAQIDAANDKVRRALVRIRVVSTDFRDGREVKMQAVGSGVIITKDGYLITITWRGTPNGCFARCGTGRKSRRN